MYLSERPRPIDFYKESPELVMDVAAAVDLSHPHAHQQPPPPPQHHHHQMLLAESSGEDHEARAPKKRAETWVQDETRCLISFRREVDSLFNTSKSNKHLWEQISNKMREKGFDRSPTMCTDKWRNLLKEFKKVKQQDRGGSGGGGAAAASGKMWYYKEIEELLRDRTKSGSHKSPPHPTPSTSKVDAFIHFSDKGLEDGGGIPFGSVEANGRTSVNLETPLDNDGDPLAITAADAVATNGVPPWNWRESPSGGEGHPSFGGRVITVKWGDYRRRIGIDGTCEAIKEAIKSAFRLRTKRAFWLEDEDNVIRSLDRDMPLGNYTLHLDEGISFKVCLYDDADRMGVHTEDKTLYTDDEFYDFLTRRGLVGLREINGYRCFSNLDDLRAGAMYQGVRRLGD